MNLAFLRALRRDRFFQLLIIVGMALSLFVPFAPRAWPGNKENAERGRLAWRD
ncbi:Putative membrane protein [Salmonella enterica subsp. enterica serovar Montevideo str. S5-403]|uniref:Putative membrane protein n=1 Tax=Salmonella enterica subsp. enterica serovar Montevideo str. S5-403 TaxID=913242 RepID=G5Q075_SALMO|nr:Putative membrane protein [Salmonella enterica subsp. enterica serovar Montevideo str. S5-403]